jgi:glycosyltransferase involved in cell wall biosynthesis
MKKIRELLKYIYIVLGISITNRASNRILVSMLNSNDKNGPGRFIRNLKVGLEDNCKYEISRNPLEGSGTFLVISSMPKLMYKLVHLLGVKIILRVDGFSYPDLYDNQVYSGEENRDTRILTSIRKKTNEQISQGLKYSDWVIYQSNFSREMCQQWLYKRDSNFSIIPNGVDTELFKSQNVQYRNKDIISIHGNLRDADIIKCALKAFELLTINTSRACTFLIIGKMTAKVEVIVNNFKKDNISMDKNIISKGQVSAEQLALILPTSSLSLHLTSADACPNSVLESLASGVPVICQSFGGQSELVGNAGVIIDTGEIYDYSDNLAKLVSDAASHILNNLTEYKLKARKQAVTNFPLNFMVSSYQEVIETLNYKTFS